MAVHDSIPSMLGESLPEMILAADYSVNFRKDPKQWGASGCYGFPAALLLFSVADAIGSYVLGGKTRKHLDILAHKDFYSLPLEKKAIDAIYKKYRNLLTHNAVLAPGVSLDIGTLNDAVVESGRDGTYCINLVPFLDTSKKAVLRFLKQKDVIVPSGKQLANILNT
jgi:hypothetical protein